MKNVLKFFIAIASIMGAGIISADYWKCPNNETQYVSKEAALNNCKTPDLCRRDCTQVVREHHHFLGIRSRHHHGDVDCKEVCGLQDLPQSKTSETTIEKMPESTVVEKKTTVKQRSNKFGDITTETKVKEKTVAKDSATGDTTITARKNCKRVCHTEFVENPGLFGHGGIAGLGIGQARGVSREVCKEVCD